MATETICSTVMQKNKKNRVRKSIRMWGEF